MLVSNATSNSFAGFETPMLRKAFSVTDADVLGVISTSPKAVLGEENSSTVRVALEGRVPVVVSLENAAYTKATVLLRRVFEGVGMRRRTRKQGGGCALTDLTLLASVLAMQTWYSKLTNAGVTLPANACLGTVWFALKVGSDLSIAMFIQDIGSNMPTWRRRLAELTTARLAKVLNLPSDVVAGEGGVEVRGKEASL